MNKKGSSGSSSSSKKKPAAGFAFAGALRELKANKFPYAGNVRPGKQTPQRVVISSSNGIASRPDYADSGTPSRVSKPLLPWIVQVKTPEEITKMRASGILARQILDLAGRQVKPGVTTDEIDRVVHQAIIEVRVVVVVVVILLLQWCCCRVVQDTPTQSLNDSLTHQHTHSYIGWSVSITLELPRISEKLLHLR
jgi:methionyl aminopeptidase